MSPAAFKSTWHKFSGKESAAYQEHFNDLCHLLRQLTPAQANPTGAASFCFFAEDTDFLPKHLFTQIARAGLDEPGHFAERAEIL